MTTFRITDLAATYTDYDMIRLHTDLPDFPELRTRLLLAFLNDEQADSSRSELYALVTSLVQIGLDTHDMVPLTNAAKEKPEARSRQLKILAGDYFSSRFYALLAQAGQIETIKVLSQAICEVNRLKMNFYSLVKQLKMTAEDYIQQSADIRSQLFLSFSRSMEGLYKRLWPDILQGFTKCELLAGEIFRLETSQSIEGGWAYWHIMQAGTREEKKHLQSGEPDAAKTRSILHKYNVSTQLYHMLESQINSLVPQIRQLGSDKLAEELNKLCEPFARYLAKPKVLEEL